MRTLIAVIFLAVCSCLSEALAANHYSIVASFTSNPSDGNTLTINGTTKTFKTVVTSASTQVEIGADAPATVANLVAHLSEFPITGVYPYVEPSLPSVFIAVADEVDYALTTSKTGSWGTSVQSITSLTQSPLVLPLVTEPDGQDRTNAANWMVIGIRDYSTTNFPATAGVMVHFMNLSEAQTVTGAKTFTGANVYSNSSQVISGGSITNAALRSMTMAYDNANRNGLEFFNSSAQRWITIAPDAGGYPTLYGTLLSATPSSEMGATGYVPSAGNILWRGAADGRYGLLIGTNLWSGSNSFHFAQLTNFTGTGTNLMLGTHSLWVSNLYVVPGGSGIFISNSAPRIEIFETDTASEDDRRWRLAVADGIMTLSVLSEDSGSASPIFNITRNGFAGATFLMNGGLSALGSFQATQGYFSQDVWSAFSFDAPVIAGQFYYLTNTTSLGTDPTSSVRFWSVSGAPFYRMPGSGTDHYLHNAASQVVGAGTDYPFTTSYAQVTFGSGGNTLTLPTAGTYLVTADVAVEAGATANAVFACKLYNSTTASDVTNSERQLSNLPASKRGQLMLQNIVTVSSATTLHLYGKNITDATGSVDSVETKLSYVRLY